MTRNNNTPYYIAHQADVRCNPNYSFEIGDVDGDGIMEWICLDQSGNRLRVVSIDGRVLFERRVTNHGNWGTPLPCAADIDGDGSDEIIVPDIAPGSKKEARIVVLNKNGAAIGEHSFGVRGKDDYGISVPLLARARRETAGTVGVVVALAGGEVVLLDSTLNEVWRRSDFRNDFGHEFYLADVDGDGADEIAFCTLDHINAGYTNDEWNTGELVILDHDGSTILRRRVDDYCPETHFDDLAFADFRHNGTVEMLTEKGQLVNLERGEVVWDAGSYLDHGQWIAHTTTASGNTRIFISELWGRHGKSSLLAGDGRHLADVASLPRTTLEPELFPGWSVLPTRCHAIRWRPDEAAEFFFAEQTCSPTSHSCFRTRHFALRAFFLDESGKLVGSLPFEDAQIEGYWYNGEVRSRVADVDNDGENEIVFPQQNGLVSVIKKRP